MSCCQNSGPLLVVDYIAAPNIQGYQVGTESWGTAHVQVCVAAGLSRFEAGMGMACFAGLVQIV